MKRFRVDFSLRETDCAEGEEPQGIRFGKEIGVEDLFAFFNACRDAAMTLFNGKVPKDPSKDKEEKQNDLIKKLKEEIERQKRQAMQPDPGIPHRDIWPLTPSRRWDSGEPKWKPGMDDGSRGGDGPPCAEAQAYYDSLTNKNDGGYGPNHR